jgi:hypothetical protein
MTHALRPLERLSREFWAHFDAKDYEALVAMMTQMPWRLMTSPRFGCADTQLLASTSLEWASATKTVRQCLRMWR